MPDTGGLDLGHSARRLRVHTLVRLRWLAVTGQLMAVLVVHVGLGFPLPLLPCLLVIAASGAVNVGLRLRFAISHRFGDTPAMAQMGYDVLQLSALLFLTGGLQNPFSMLFLAPVMISAASLPSSSTLALVTLTGIAATLLVFVHLPLPWFPGQALQLPFLFTAGVWVAIISGTAFIGVYGSRIAEEARKLSDALAATELVLAREQHLSQLDGIAAAAAHELGTPLATITLVVRDMMEWLRRPAIVLTREALEEDVCLLDQEVRRCRTILSKISSLGSDTGPLQTMSLPLLLAEVVEPLRHFGVPVTITTHGEGREPVSPRNPGILYGLGNIVENAIDFAAGHVTIDMAWSRDNVAVSIRDDGNGFSPDVLTRLGEPYVTTRGPERRAKAEAGAGLGLGLFIAKTLLERSGASVSMRNLSAPSHGALVTIAWARNHFEREGETRKVEGGALSATLARLS